MSTGFYSIGVSGLAAAQLGLLATEHNVVNANTPGYTRQRTVQATNVAVNTGAGSIGMGVHVATIERMYDRFLTGQVNTAQTQVSELDTYYSQIKQIDGMLADPNSGLSPALQDFFTGVQQVASNPSSLPARQSMISSAETLATRFHNLDTRLGELTDQVNGRIAGAVSSINSYATQIASVNQSIVISESGYGQPANDLLDQRDQLVTELNKLIKVSTTTNSDGSYNVFVGSGQQLVVGTQVMELTATASKSDPSKIVVGLKTAGGTQEFPDSLINGGELGGLITFRNESLDPVINELGRDAASLALTFNAQHALGQDLLGKVSGDVGFVGDFFTIPKPKVIASENNSATSTGLPVASFVTPPNPPTAANNFSGNFYTDLTTSDYQMAYDGTNYKLTRDNDGATWTDTSIPNLSAKINSSVLATNPWGPQGFTLAAGTGTYVAGDQFVIKPVAEAGRNIDIDSRVTADPRLIAAGAPVRVTQALGNLGSMKMSQGLVGVGYSAPLSASPVTLTTVTASAPATGAALTGISVAWTAVYSNGATASGTGAPPPSPATDREIGLTNGIGTLAKITFSGMTFDINGTPTVGDKFSVERNTNGVQDGRNAVLFAKLQTQNTVAGGNATYQAAYASLVADNGIRTRETKIRLDAQTSVLTQAQDTRDSLSGVNLDEEAANMLKFQQAYLASSKILEIGNKLFDTILSL